MGKIPNLMNNTLELLAPAGNMVCLHAAIRAGADAVYLGADRFNARRGADNFTLESLAEACDYAHVRGRRIYLTVNTVILPGEREAALELVRQAYRRGVDGFIMQDVGLAAEVHRTLPEAEIHISTQMNTHNVAGLDAAVSLGASRVTLAREMALSEVVNICAEAAARNLEVEIFAHGALCVCYSGQCLMSSMIGGRSANRGMCAQACRLPYELHNRAVRKDLPSPGEHLLSPKDLCLVNRLPELALCGVSSLKIEGRMKSPEYVSAVVGVYRSVLDRVLAWVESGQAASDDDVIPGELRATPEEMRVLEEAFSRGFTEGYLMGEDDNEMMSYGRPNNRGVFIGRVFSVGDGWVAVDPEETLHEGDVLEFWTNRGHFAHTVSGIEAVRGGVRFALDRRVGKGDRVFRVRSAEAQFVDVPFEPKVAVSGSVVIQLGQPISLTLTAPSGASVCAQGPVAEPARTKALLEEDVRDHIDRFGNTPFELQGLEIQLDEGVGMGFSQIHKLRAAAAEQLEEALLADYRARTLHRAPAKPPVPRRPRRNSCQVAVWATNAACARAAKRAGADAIYVPALNYKRGESLVAGQISGTVAQTGYPKQAIIAMPVVDHDPLPGTREERLGFDAWKYVKADKPVFVENLSQLVRAHEMGAHVEVGPHVPVSNPLSAMALAQMGAERVWLSPELTLGQIQQIGDETDVELGLFVSGATELMVTEHCMLMSQGPCNRDCSVCPRRKSPHYLKDRKGYEMPVVTDCTGRSHLYNAVPLDILHVAPDLIAAGVSSFMVDATMMNVEETTKATARAVRARDIALKSGNAVGKTSDTTSGHLFRGIS